MNTFVFFTLFIAFICGIGIAINFGIICFNQKYPNSSMWLCLFVGVALMVVVPITPINVNGIIFHDMPPDLHLLIARISLSLNAINAFAIGMVAVAICLLMLSWLPNLSKLSKKKNTAKETAAN